MITKSDLGVWVHLCTVVKSEYLSLAVLSWGPSLWLEGRWRSVLTLGTNQLTSLVLQDCGAEVHCSDFHSLRGSALGG